MSEVNRTDANAGGGDAASNQPGAAELVSAGVSAVGAGGRPKAQHAEEVKVVLADREVVGYLIRSDAVLVLEADIELPATVVVGEQKVEADGAYPTSFLDPSPYKWTALQLPVDVVEPFGERIPPGVEIPEDDSKGSPARRSIWCWFFPRLSGC